MDDVALWRVAGELIKLYGEDARFIAARRADALLDDGDVDGFHSWKRIANMLRALQYREPDPGCTTH